MSNESRRRERSKAASGGSLTSAATLAPAGSRGNSFDMEAERWRQRLQWRPQRQDPNGPSGDMVRIVELVLSEPAPASRSKPTPRRLRKRLDTADGVTPNWATILVGGAIGGAVLSLVFDSYWGGMLLSASILSGMISVANRRGARRLADLYLRHGRGLITGSEYETEREDIIHPRIPDYWSAVG